MKSIFLVLLCLAISSFVLIGTVSAATFVEFNDFTVTPESSAPTSSGGWTYSGANNDVARWEKDTGYQTNSSIHNYFAIYNNTYNSEHMGFENYGFLQITDGMAVSGNALEYAITGGKNITTCPDADTNCNANGLELHNKQQYLDYLSNSQNPVDGTMVVGQPYLYFGNTAPNETPTHFESSQSTNRLSMYVWVPDGMTIGAGGSSVPPDRTLSIGPYSNVPKSDVYPNDTSGDLMGGHFYHDIALNGGGWAHIQVDGHPQHNNGFSDASLYPYPSKSMRDIGTPYFNNLWRFYFSIFKENGFDTPKFSIYFDKIEFINDTEPQNVETIATLSILYKDDVKSFEISFCDKYKDNAYSYSTYELRYSFSPITNDNWDSASPAQITANNDFSIEARTDGKFDKTTPYYEIVWAPFTLSTADTASLTDGTTVYFAVKDIGNIDSNGDPTQTPNTSLTGTASRGGRDYANYSSDFDYAGDSAVLTKIRRTDFIIKNRVNILAPPSLRID